MGGVQVCVPFNASSAADFDPDAVPTVAGLLEELGPCSVPPAQLASRPVSGAEWGNTALAGCMNAFCRRVQLAVLLVSTVGPMRACVQGLPGPLAGSGPVRAG